MAGYHQNAHNEIKWSIKLKAMSFLSLLLIGLVSILTYTHLSEQKAMLENELQKRIVIMKEHLIEKGKSFIGSLGTQLENKIAAYNFSGAIEAVHTAAKINREIQYAVLVDASGQVFTHTRNPALVRKIAFDKKQLHAVQRKTIVVQDQPDKNFPAIRISAPLQISTIPWGEVQLVYTLKYLQDEIDQSRSQIQEQIYLLFQKTLITSAATIFIMLAVVYFLVSKLLSPIIQLTRFANQLSSGDFSTANTVPVHYHDEVGVLASAFLDMKKELGLTYEKLKDSNRTLEQKVKERTAALHSKNRELNKANRTKSQFIANISHEIKTPMTAIIGMTDLLLRKKVPDIAHDKLVTIKQSAATLMQMINGILDFSKIEAGKIKLEQVRFKLTDITGSLIDTFSIKLEKKAVELIILPDDNLPKYLVGDPLRLKQVLSNLIDNAVKFTDYGEIFVHIQALTQEKSRIELLFTIQDTGIGISPSKIPILFDSFTQADGSTTRKYGGTGLGLTISRQLVSIMSGEITVESCPGKGSLFRINAWFGQDPLPPETTRHAPARPYAGNRILIAESNTTHQKLLQSFFARQGAVVDIIDTKASLSSHLTNVFTRQDHNLVLLDARRAEDLDKKTMALIVDQKRHSPTTVVLLLGAGRDAAEYPYRFIDGWVSKPIKWEQMNDTLAAIQAKPVYSLPPGMVDSSSINREPITGDAGEVDLKAIQEALAALTEMITENDIQAKNHIAHLRKQLLGLGVSETVNHLTRQLARFDFKNARKTVTQLTRSLNDPKRKNNI